MPCPQCGAPKSKAALLCGTCRRKLVGPEHGSWRGGRTRTSDGYVRVYAPEHPYALNGRYVLEHKLVMEQRLGRYLEPDERVHHVNTVRDDNDDSNLELWVTGHPTGCRIEDALAWAHKMITRYEETA